MRHKDEISRAADAYSKLHKKIDKESFEYNEFALGFETSDFSSSLEDGKLKVTAKISKKDFDRIIYSYGVYIANYLKEKGISV